MEQWLRTDSGPLTEYPFAVTEIIPVGDDSFELKTDAGPRLLRVVERREERLWFAHSVAVHLAAGTFSAYARPVFTRSGRPFATEDGLAFCVTQWVPGRAVDAARPADIAAQARTLAEFHRAATGLSPLPGAASRRLWGRWPEKIAARRDDLLRFKHLAGRRDAPTAFDELFLAEADYLCQLAGEAMTLLSGPVYAGVAKAAAAAGEVALRRVGRNGFIIDPQGRAIIRDLSGCRYDLTIADLARFLTGVMRRERAGCELGEEALSAYLGTRGLSPEELVVLFSLLRFPSGTFRALDRYYNFGRNWPEEGFRRKLAVEIDVLRKTERRLAEMGRRHGVVSE